MAFNANDYYTVVDGVKLYGYWNPFVTKFSSDSFYNWEQDNLPLYDLEERTEFLWERCGWAGSSLPGLALLVEDTKEEGNNNSFDSLQDAIDALPDVIRMPIMIEVIKTGDLGKIDVKNIKFGEGGSLEILNTCRIDINSNEYKAAGIDDHDINRYSFFAINSKVTDTTPTLDALNDTVSLLRPGYNLAANGHFPAISSNDGTKLKGAFFVAPTGTNTGTKHRPDRPSMHSYEQRDLLDGSDANSDADAWAGNNSIVTRDFSNEYTSLGDPTASLDLTSVISRSYADPAKPLAVGHGVTGTWTNNVVRGINIINCDGPIYIRGFIVDGTNSYNANDKILYQDFGITVQNSQKVYIENCASMRNKMGGLLVTNSDVVLNRKFLTGRNHPFTSTEQRAANEHYGMKLVNANLTLSSDTYCNGKDSVFMCFENDYGIHANNSVIIGVKTSAASVTTNPSIKCCYNKKAGVKSINSTIEVDCDFDLYSNTVGLELVDSDISAFRMFAQYNSVFGINAYSSRITYGKQYDADLTSSRVATAANNLSFGEDGVKYDYDIVFFGNGRHIKLENSTYAPVYQTNMPNRSVAGIVASHRTLRSSENDLVQYYSPAIEAINSKIDLVHHKISTTKVASTPFATEVAVAGGESLGTALTLINSHASILGTASMASIISGPTENNRHTGVYVSKNSSCRISGPTHISGFRHPIVVDTNSDLEMCPHEVDGSYVFAKDQFNLTEPLNHTSVELGAHGECLIVDNNSTVTMRDLGSALDKYPVEYMVSNDIYFLTETSSLYHAGGIVFAPNNPDTGGGTAGDLGSPYNSPTSYVFTSDNFNEGNKPYNHFRFGGDTLGEVAFRNYSKGGVCVQAHNNSNIKVHNVCFHTGAINADDVFYDSETLAGCADLRIWAFGTGATLDAAHLAVSGTYPSLAGYHGPRAAYFSSYDETTTLNVAYTAFRQYPYGFSGLADEQFLGKVNPASGIPVMLDHYSGSALSGATHPYVGGLAVLDFFGSGVIASGYPDFPEAIYTNFIRNSVISRYDPISLNTRLTLGANTTKFWGASGYENTGPFRLYLEPDPICQYLVYMSGTEPTNWGCPSGFAASADNRVYQTVSQGYHLSGPVSGDPYYIRTWKPSMQYAIDTDGVITREVSGYPDVAELVRPENYNVRLDESAAHAFANAKHCSINFLGRPPLVEIYRNGNLAWGARQDTANQDPGYGYGFKSPHTYHDRRR